MMFVKDDDVIQTFAERRKVEMLFAHLNWHLCGWSPGFLGAFSVPKYHFHFLSDDHQHGGHVLERAAPSLRLRMEALTNFHLALPERAAFLKADLNKNSSDELAYSEEAHYANTNGGKIRPADWCYRGQTAQMIGMRRSRGRFMPSEAFTPTLFSALYTIYSDLIWTGTARRFSRSGR